MAKKILVTLLFLFCSGIGFSQSGFKKGYVIMNSNDTIFGLIKSGTKRENMLKCVFKESQKSKKITYLPESIKAYRFTDGKYYISGSVDSAKTEKVFLEYLINGIVDIYYTNNETGDHYFISKNEKFNELQNQTIRSYRVTPEAGVSKSYNESSPLLYERQSKNYIGILKLYFSDSPESMKKAENISLTHNSLIKIAGDYHKQVCPDEACITYANKLTKINVRFVPSFGFSSSKLSLNIDGPVNKFGNYPKSTGSTFGLYLDISDSFFSERLSLVLGTTSNQYKYSSGTSSINMNTLEFPVLFRYSFLNKKFRPSLIVGPLFGGVAKFDSKSDKYSTFYFTNKTIQFGLAAGIETEYKFNKRTGIFVQLRYDVQEGNGFVGYLDDTQVSFALNHTNINLTAGFKF